MNFLSPGALYFLPLALLPLRALIRKKSSKVKLVSWLVLFKDKELLKRRKPTKSLIIILRCLILALLIVFLAKPVPTRYAFGKIYFETGIFSPKVEKKLKENLKFLISYYGERVETFCDPLEPDPASGGEFYIVSDFSDPLLSQRFSGGFCYDTLSICNMGIRSVEFDPVTGAYYLEITNYNSEDSTFDLVVYKNSEKVYVSNIILPKGESILWKKEVHGIPLKVCMEVEDDIITDNCVELRSPERLQYHLVSKNLYVRNFMRLLGVETSLDSADVIISFNQVIKPGKRTKEVIVFFDKPVGEIILMVGNCGKKLPAAEISGWNFGKVFVFDTSRCYTDIESLLNAMTCSLKLDGTRYIFIGIVPDIEKNEAVYCPDFWSYLLKILKIKPVIAYTSNINKVGKILNDTLLLQDTLQTNTAHACTGGFQSKYVPLQDVIRSINTIKYIILSLLGFFVALELYLTHRYFAD